MKNYFIQNNIKKLVVLASVVTASMLADQAGAQINQFWDNNGTSAPNSGNWDTNSAYWNGSTNLSTAAPVAFTNGNFAAFSAGAGTIASMTITVPNIVTCTGIGDGVPTCATITTLTFNGAGPINFPTGMWNIDCGVGSIVINTPIAGPGGIAQHNSGAMYLYGTNTYSGGTSATGGQVIYYNNSNSFGTGPISTSGGSTSFWCTNGPGAIVTLTNAWTVSAGTSIINIVSGDTICSGNWTLGTSFQLKNSGPAGQNLTVSGAIGGAYGIDFESVSGGTIILSGANTYTGATTNALAGATSILSVSSINSVTTPAPQASSSLGKPSSAANGTISLGTQGSGGELIYTGNGETSDRVINLAGSTGGGVIEMDGTGPLVLTSAFTTTGSGAKTLTLQGSSTATNTIGGAIPNSTSATTLTKAQAGTWVLGGKNTFTGNTTISAGTLTIGLAGDLGNSGGNGSYAGTISDSGTFVYNSSAAQTLSGVISGAGSLQQNGAGNLTLTNVNTYTGATTVGSGSTLIVSAEGKIAQNSQLIVNGTFNLTSTAGQIVDLVGGSGLFNLATANTTSETFTNLNNTFSGLLTINGGTLAINGDGCLGAVPGSFVANDITLNGGTPSGLRANAAGISLNVNRGIFLGPNGGEIQVAGSAGTMFCNGIISGSGPFQAGQNATTGPGVLVLSAAESYTNTTIIACGTLRLTLGASLGNSSGIIMSNSTVLDVSTQNLFALSTTNTFTAIGGTNTTTTILGASGGSVDFGAQTVNLSFVPTLATGDPTNEALTVSQSALLLNGNTVNVTNASTLPLDVGNYALVICTNGITVSSPLTLNYFGPSVANTTTSLAVIGNALVLQVAAGAAYAGTTFTNQTPSQSVTYGTLATFSGTVNAAGPTYPNMGESVNVAIANLVTNSTTISDSTGDFTLTMPTNTVSVGTYVITYFYPGTNSTLTPATDSSTTLTITKAPVTVTATNQTKTYGQTVTNGAGSTAFTATGLQNSETIGTVTLAISGSGGVSNAPVAGSPYTITPSAATGGTFKSGNYAITYVTGTLTVNPLPVGLTGTRYYDGTATADFSILSITNIVGTDVVNTASGSVTLAAPAVGSEPITDASGLTLGGISAGNYTTAGAIGAVNVTVNSNTTNVVFAASNNVLTLSWPIDHTGWTLQAQTNDVTVGISTNWADVSGSDQTNEVVIPADPTSGCVFYRLYYTP